jgi:phosphomannomutase
VRVIAGHDARSVVARDGRLSGPELSQALIRGLRMAGCDVIDIGAAPTPVLYFRRVSPATPATA